MYMCCIISYCHDDDDDDDYYYYYYYYYYEVGRGPAAGQTCNGQDPCEEFTRLAETRLAQNTLNYINISIVVLHQTNLNTLTWTGGQP